MSERQRFVAFLAIFLVIQVLTNEAGAAAGSGKIVQGHTRSAPTPPPPEDDQNQHVITHTGRRSASTGSATTGSYDNHVAQDTPPGHVAINMGGTADEPGILGRMTGWIGRRTGSGNVHAHEDTAPAHQGPAHAPQDPAHAPQGPAHAPQGPAHAPQGPAHAPQGPAHGLRRRNVQQGGR